MPMWKDRGVRSVLAGGVVLCLLAGCSSDKPSVAPPTTAATTQTSVSFNGVTVAGATDLAAKPQVSARSTSKPTALQIKDVVTGTGTAATPTSMVTVQYVGVQYGNGKQFDASWDKGGAISFSLQQVVPGFTQGISGTATVPAMKVGGRRIMIVPSALGYGAAGSPDGRIPPNTPIVFLVDLIGIS